MGSGDGAVPLRDRSIDGTCAGDLDPLLSKEFPLPGVVGDRAEWFRVEDDPDAVDQTRYAAGVVLQRVGVMQSPETGVRSLEEARKCI